MTVVIKYCIIALAIVLSASLVFAQSSSTDHELEIPDIKHPDCQLLRAGLHQGFHREVESNVTVTFASTSESPFTDCEVMLKEHIMTGLYVDLYQTYNNYEFGGPKVYSAEDIDLELPEFLSKNYTVYIYSGLTSQNMGTSVSWQANLTVPIHVRYHKPSLEDLYAKAVLPPPEVYLRCQLSDSWVDQLWASEVVAAPCSKDTSVDCEWVPLSCTGAQSLTFEVPVGQLRHYTLVVVVTMVVTLGATFFLMYVIIVKSPRADVKVDDKKTS